MNSSTPFVVVRRFAYGVEYLNGTERWTPFSDEALRFHNRVLAEAACKRVGGHAAVTPSFARLWAGNVSEGSVAA